jgi:hypothetical protein
MRQSAAEYCGAFIAGLAAAAMIHLMSRVA